jgi:hypothetical protein
MRPRRLSGASGRPVNFTVRTRVDALLAPILTFLGLFGGTVFGTQMLRWGTLLWVSTTTHGGDFLGPPKHRLLWVFTFVLLLHPAPYLLTCVVLLTVWALQSKVAPFWLWVLAGFYTYVVLASLKMLQAYRLHRRRLANAGPNIVGGGRERRVVRCRGRRKTVWARGVLLGGPLTSPLGLSRCSPVDRPRRTKECPCLGR